MGVIVVPLLVKAADSQPPAAVLVPAHGLHVAGFHGDHRGSHLPHEVVAQMLAAETVAPGYAEVVEITVRKALGDGGKCLQPVFCDPDGFRVAGGPAGDAGGQISARGFAGGNLRLKLAHHSVQHRAVGFTVILVVFHVLGQRFHGGLAAL